MVKEILLVRGVPGSGKTDFVQTLLAMSHPGAMKAVAADDFAVDESGKYVFDVNKLRENHEQCQDRVREWADTGISFIVVHNTFTTLWEMEPYFEIARQHGYKIRTIVVERRHSGTNVHDVPSKTIQNMVDRFNVKL